MAINLNVTGNTQPLEAAVQSAVNRIRKTPIKISVDDKGVTQPLGNMKRGADEFSKSMEAANARIIAFGASMAIINGVADSFKAMVRNMVEVEKSLADINVVMGLSVQNLDKFGDGLFKVAKETGAAFKVAADAATEYARQGLGVEESLKRTRDALILTRLTGMDSAEAVKALTAAMNTYGDQIKDTTQLVSKFAAVDVKFAVSAEDFAAAISRTGQAAKSAGVSIDELVGIVTSAQQQTARGGAVIGNALKTIFTKTGRQDTLNQLEDLGIAVRDLEGNTVGAKRILTELANTFDKLTEAQKSQITQTMGGLFHINILKAVLSDAAKQNGILAEATGISSQATDEAIQKNQELRNTMAAMAHETGMALKQMSSQVGEIMLAPGMEKVLNIVKSIAEGASDLLGTGEGAGNTFAKGFLKGVGNIITGPGLVIMMAVFGKLLVKGAVYAKDSLKSLIGVTSEAQKQKAIQTSLVTLFSQNATLNKEMLRTDISRTQKEATILSLLKAQVQEANTLNLISKQAASTLYRQGFGANLAPRRGRAAGHIPNFAHPERAQAAQGGYAAGNIRSMNMPGEGPIIYNSAETVRNFAGFKQPAIMPPKSSKAGQNYQQAFGNIHGFDPYAAGGYIPNYAKSDKGSIINKDKKMVVFAASMDRGGKYAGINDDLNNIFSIKEKGGGFKLSSDPAAKGFSRVNVPYFGISKKDAQIDQHKDFQSLINGRLIEAGQKVAGEIAAKILGKNYSVRGLKEGDVAAASGNIFEAAIMALQSGIAREAREKDPGGTALLDIPRAGRDKLWEVFGAEGFGGLGAEAKIALGGAGKIGSHLKSAAEKFYKIEKKGLDPFIGRKTDASKTSDLRKGVLSRRGGRLFVGGEPWSSSNKEQTTLLRKAGFKPLQSGKFSKVGLNSQLKSHGYIPNFANPLSDAIGREKAAGVPVSQIRVGSHDALMSKGNPLGLGVTNTYDEPNGLKDVFGANGFVPNYAQDYFQTSDIESSAGNRKERNRLMLKLNKELKQELKQLPKGRKGQEKLAEIIRSLGQKYKANESAVKKVTKANQTMGYRLTRGIGGMGSGMGGMGLMMGLPMLAGFIPGADKPGSGANMLSGALTGAGTGAGIGMMFGPLGVAIGGAVGAFGGLVSTLANSKKAIQEESEQRAKSFASFFPLGDMVNKLSGPGGAGGMTTGKFLGNNSNLLEKKTDVLNVATGEITNQQSIIKQTNPMLNKTVKDVLSQTLPSVPASFEEFRQISKTLPSGQKKIDESQIIYGGGRDLNEALRNRVQSAQADLSKYNVDVKNIGGAQREIIFNLLDSMSSTVDMFPDLIKGENGSISFSEESKSMQTYGQFAQKIAGMLEGEQGLKNLDEVTKLLVQKMDESFVAQSKQNEATILRINSEKILLDSQNKFNQEIQRATSSQASMNNQYAYMMKVRADFMTKEEKFNATYLNAIRNASKERQKSNIKAKQEISGGVLKTLMSKDYQQSFKDYLKETDDLSGEKFSKTNLEQRRKILEIVGKKANLEDRTTLTLAFQKAQLTKLKADYQEIERLAKNKALSEKKAEQSLLKQKTGPQAFQYGFAAQQKKMRESAAELDNQLGGIVATNFRDGLVSGMRAAINQAENLGDVLQGVAMNFLQAIQNAYLTAAANQIVGAIPMPGINKSRGGSIRNYSRGGGVPAMVSNGEYVMGRNAVAKYGGAFMHGLNSGGTIPGFNNGGAPGSALAANFGGGRGFASGRSYQSRAMSGFFYSQSGNVGLEADEQSLMGILAEEESARQAAAAKKAKKKAFWKQLLGTALSAGLSYGVDAGAKKGLFGNAAQQSALRPSSAFVGPMMPKYQGGPIRKYADGGHIVGKSGIDQIPAMLSEGEYVIRASSARQIGRPMLDRINAGKFNDGGSVSPLNSTAESGISGGNTNNINISINMESGKVKSNTSDSSSSGQNPVDRSNSQQDSNELAEKIKQQVVSVIVEEQRPGGLLSD